VTLSPGDFTTFTRPRGFPGSGRVVLLMKAGVHGGRTSMPNTERSHGSTPRQDVPPRIRLHPGLPGKSQLPIASEQGPWWWVNGGSTTVSASRSVTVVPRPPANPAPPAPDERTAVTTRSDAAPHGHQEAAGGAVAERPKPSPRARRHRSDPPAPVPVGDVLTWRLARRVMLDHEFDLASAAGACRCCGASWPCPPWRRAEEIASLVRPLSRAERARGGPPATG
jgi:hypothetical protein